nr:hypothetical protein OG284_36135 [Streptomyces sp. NBC_01177]
MLFDRVAYRPDGLDEISGLLSGAASVTARTLVTLHVPMVIDWPLVPGFTVKVTVAGAASRLPPGEVFISDSPSMLPGPDTSGTEAFSTSDAMS